MGSEDPDEGRVPVAGDSPHRAIVAAVRDADGSLHVEELADRLVRRDAILVETAEYEDEFDRATLELHHDHLPKLADAGLVEYDSEANVVTDGTPSASAVDWEGARDIPALVTELRSAVEPDADDIGILEGREAVIEYGRRLADEAEEELFCMYVATDLLEAECLRRARNAIDRGVDMCMGSGNPAVRELTREELPEATIWEPQLDWLNRPTYPRVGRLVVADRRQVMLAVLEEPTDDGVFPAETAVVGEGEDNPLVVLVRELLGARLDHLDYQSTDFRSELST